MYSASLEYNGVKLLYNLLDPQEPFPLWVDAVLAEILEIAYKGLDESPRQMYRVARPLKLALLKTRDRIHHSWIEGQVRRASILLQDVESYGSIFLGAQKPGATMYLD